MATIPTGAEGEVAFISGVTDTAKVAGTAFGTWERGTIPATYRTTTSTAKKWGDGAFGSSGGSVAYWFDSASGWTPVEKDAFAACLALWSAEANITFTLASGPNAADQTFFRLPADSKRAYQTFISATASTVGSSVPGKAFESEIHIDTSPPYWRVGTSFEEAGGYGWQTVVHEIGHMLGLGHGGPYNGNVDTSAQQFSAYDTRLWALMSYISPTAAARFTDTYPVTGTDWGTSSGTDPFGGGYPYGPTTPMIVDILAIQRIYGAAKTGPLASGGQVFGFNSNIAAPVKQFFDFTVNQHPVVTIWDGGTKNTLDLSGFSKQSTVSLNPGTFTSANGMRNNIAIAMDTVIEKVVGGAGNDRFTGSAANNIFVGNGGDDTIDGGAGADTAVFAGQRSQYTLTALGDGGVKVAGPEGTDILKSVELLQFDDQSVDWPLGAGNADRQANALTDQSAPFGQVPLGRAAAGTIDSKGDRDWYAVELAAGVAYTIELDGGTLINPVARLYSGTGALLAQNDDIVPGGNLDSRLSFVPTVSGTYYVEAGASGDGLAGTYSLSLSSPASRADDLANSLTDTTHPLGLLTVGGSGSGTLEVPTDRDWFRVKLAAGETYVVSLTGTTSGGEARLADPYLRLHDAAGDVVAENDDIAGGDTTDSQLVFAATETGFYYVEAGSYQDRYSGAYVVEVAAANGTDDYAGALDDPFHPLGRVVSGGSAPGDLETAGDRDWFSLQVTAGTTYHIGLAGIRGGGGSLADPLVIVHGADGVALAANDDIIGGDTDSQLDFIAATSGTYYVEAASFNDLYAGTYTITAAASKTIDDDVTALYAGYCDRAPDAAGEAYWVGRLAAGMGLGEIARSFAAQPEPQGVYGFLAHPDPGDAAALHAFVGEIYANLFNRTPDAAGEAYWIGQLKAGLRPTGLAIVDIISGAQGDDVLAVENKVTVGTYYVAQTVNNQVAMTPDSARTVVEGVGPDATSVSAGKSAVDLFVAQALYPDPLPVLGAATNADGQF
ncbi:MAG: pre-peptidase C-terminal domain-containing protein [Reyranellaceae bacterium]